MLTFRGFLGTGGKTKRAESVDFNGMSYYVGRLLDALEESRGHGDSLDGDDAPRGTRKTSMCSLRLVNIMVGDGFRSRMIESDAQAPRAGRQWRRWGEAKCVGGLDGSFHRS